MDTILSEPTCRPGGVVAGKVHLRGGGSPVDIRHVTLALMPRMQNGYGGEEAGPDVYRGALTRSFRLEPGQERSLAFSIPLPYELPFTTVLGRELPGFTIGLCTEVDTIGVPDPGDIDPISVEPLQSQQWVLAAIAQLGFRIDNVAFEQTKLVGAPQQLPFYQEIQLRPPPKYQGRLGEVGLSFVASPKHMAFVLTSDRRETSDDVFKVEHAAAAETDWAGKIGRWLDAAASRPRSTSHNAPPTGALPPPPPRASHHTPPGGGQAPLPPPGGPSTLPPPNPIAPHGGQQHPMAPAAAHGQFPPPAPGPGQHQAPPHHAPPGPQHHAPPGQHHHAPPGPQHHAPPGPAHMPPPPPGHGYPPPPGGAVPLPPRPPAQHYAPQQQHVHHHAPPPPVHLYHAGRRHHGPGWGHAAAAAGVVGGAAAAGAVGAAAVGAVGAAAYAPAHFGDAVAGYAGNVAAGVGKEVAHNVANEAVNAAAGEGAGVVGDILGGLLGGLFG
ncbi:sporulation protein [Spirillospora sp. CA-294931]|uniref:sporulation protein n=1 Tax=Spirillospora sp. CA-294931 TaxID=3240042 RepID=UPI003D8B3069